MKNEYFENIFNYNIQNDINIGKVKQVYIDMNPYEYKKSYITKI